MSHQPLSDKDKEIKKKFEDKMRRDGKAIEYLAATKGKRKGKGKGKGDKGKGKGKSKKGGTRLASPGTGALKSPGQLQREGKLTPAMRAQLKTILCKNDGFCTWKNDCFYKHTQRQATPCSDGDDLNDLEGIYTELGDADEAWYAQWDESQDWETWDESQNQEWEEFQKWKLEEK